MHRILHEEKLRQARTAVKAGMHVQNAEKSRLIEGELFMTLWNPKTEAVLEQRHHKNIITLDSGILSAILYSSRTSSRGANMLAVGTGATGNLLNPDSPDPRQRSLNAEIERKAFSSTVFRASDGSVSAIPTNVVDYTTTYGEGEAVGPLNEMSLLSTVSDNPLVKNPVIAAFPAYDPTVDLTQFDISINYLTFAVLSKPSTAALTLTWRLTF